GRAPGPRTLLASLALLLAAGCSLDPLTPSYEPEVKPPADEPLGDVPLLGVGVDCDPMVPTACGYPFPSSIYLVADPTTPTGKRVHFGATTLPTYGQDGARVDRSWWDRSDGFSAGQAPMTHMPGATAAGLPTQDDIERSITGDSPTVLLDADTGELVPHFSEIDMSAKHDEARALMIRPVVRLKDATRYIVAIRRVVDASGAEIAPSPVFQALRDAADHDDPSVRLRRALYDDIFARLEAAGIERGGLQIAWDYVTASRENNTRWLLHMRDDALAAVGDEGPEYTIVSVEENPNQHIRRRILGKMNVPLYLDDPGPGGRLVFGEDGLPVRTGTAEYEFLVHIPNSAANGTPGALLQNGHGLLGTKNEGRNGYLAQLADMKGYVAFSVDLVGMAEDDELTVTTAIAGDIGGFQISIDRQHQGILNSLLAMRMMKGRFWRDPLVQFNGKSAIDPTHCYYRGDSQGGIFGTTYMALTTDVTRGLLGEPGMPYNLLLNRSTDFTPFFLLLRGAYKNDLNIQLGLGLIQMLWDRTEPSGYAPYIHGDTLPNTPSHDVLLHVAIGDYQVTPLGAHIIARAVGAKNLSPVNRSVWGIDERSGPFYGSGMVEFDFGLPESPKTNTPPEGPEDDDPHDKVRVLEAARAQTDTFLRTGEVRPYCDGPCDPE
ncbi:MAG: hypothetical protein IT372_35510, partial [Polyangiaceae bacterium]|nr:hypothetical protein [Polyangiaceae bacterium]